MPPVFSLTTTVTAISFSKVSSLPPSARTGTLVLIALMWKKLADISRNGIRTMNIFMIGTMLISSSKSCLRRTLEKRAIRSSRHVSAC